MFRYDSDINELLFRLLDNEISDQDFVRLEQWLRSDRQAKHYYCQFMENYSALSLRAMTAIQEPEDIALQEELLNENFWKLMSEEEVNAPPAEIIIPEQKQKPDIIRKVQKERAVRTINKTSLSLAIASLAALFVMIAYVYMSGPAPYEVATVSDSMEAKWSSDLDTKPGTRISSYTKPIQLTRGVVKLITDNQVEVLIEAPAEFKFTSYSEIALNYGKLFACVSGQGRGFSVATPNAKVVDLGTEFGVISQIDGNTEVYMYKGKANLFAGQKSENKISELLMAGSAKKVDRADSKLETIPLEENLVVRNIDSQTKFIWRGEALSLADIVGGGNGFGTGQVDRGIEPSTGNVIDSLTTTDVYPGPQGYLRVSSTPYIDGVFVPGIDPDATPITSMGLMTHEFPKTSGRVWGYIFNGAWHCGLEVSRHHLQLDGVTLGGKKNPAMTMHSNLGITFDLSAMRAAIPSMRIKSFSSTFGVSQTVSQWIQMRNLRDMEQTPEVVKFSKSQQSSAEFWVFLDGKNVWRQTLSSASKAGTVNVPIHDDVRFLTLAVTEADDTFMFDWGVFAQPKLVLEPVGQ